MPIPIPCTIMRGGTSRAVFFYQEDLPENPDLRNSVILSALGSPDPRQIDGLGGADPLTSKVAIVSPSEIPEMDVNYTFGYVGIDRAVVDYRGNCGNISSAVGPFAVDKGWVKAKEPITCVRIFNTNTKKVIEAHVPVRGGAFDPEGDFTISGVPGSGSRILLNFLNSGGAVTGKVLPTGKTKDFLYIEGYGRVCVSIVDVANPFVFVHAEDLGLEKGEWMGRLFQGDGLAIMEKIRLEAARIIGLTGNREEAHPAGLAVPKVAVVAPPARSSSSEGGDKNQGKRADIIAWMTALQRLHRTYAVTGGICLAAASCIPGTVVNEILGGKDMHREIVIGHPSGTMEVEAEIEEREGEYTVKKGIIARTARKIMEGWVFIPERVFGRAP